MNRINLTTRVIPEAWQKVKIVISGILKSKIVEAIWIGVIAGLIVAFLLNIPNVSMVDTKVVTQENGTINFKFIFENKGNSPAQNVKVILAYRNLKGDAPIIKNSGTVDCIETGDVFNFSANGLDIHANSNIMLIKVTYEDSSKIRAVFNKNFAGNPYQIERFGTYREPNHRFSMIDEKAKESYGKELLMALRE